MVVLPAGAPVPAYAKKKGKLCRQCISKTPVITVDHTLKDEISKLYLTTENAFFKPFIILSCESTLPPHLKQRPTPCEIAAVAYCMETGLIDSFHQFIDPGTLPIGFTYEAQFHSTETHKIPNSQFEYAVKDIQKTYTALQTFIVREAPDCIVFALKSEQRHVQSAVDWLKQNSHQTCLRRVRVLVLEDLLSELITLSGYKVPVQLTNCLLPQHLKYLSDICCAWHSNQDLIVCALGSSVRLCYASAALLYKYYDQIVWGPSHAPQEGLEVAQYTQTRDLDDNKSIVSRYMRANSAVHRLPSYSDSSAHEQPSNYNDRSAVDTVDTSVQRAAPPANRLSAPLVHTNRLSGPLVHTQHRLPSYVSKVNEWDTASVVSTACDSEAIVVSSSRRACAWKPSTPPEPSNPRPESQIVKPTPSHKEPATSPQRTEQLAPKQEIPIVSPQKPFSSPDFSLDSGLSSLRIDAPKAPEMIRSKGRGEPMVRPLIGRGRVVADAMRGRGIGRGQSSSPSAQPGVVSRRPKPKNRIG